MRVHHLSCGTMCPVFGSTIRGSQSTEDGMICHCLLIETDDGLALVDTGIGLTDMQQPERLGSGFVRFVRPLISEDETAARQVERLGYKREDVRHVIPTHLDLDHAGGLPDFPKAKVHIYARELDAAMARASLLEKERYKRHHWAHDPDWVTYEVQGEPWFGFEAVRSLEGLPPEILLVPTIGHTRGHVAVAIDSDRGWMLHAGDAYFSHDEMHPETPSCPPGLRFFQRLVATDNVARVRNRERIRLLAREGNVNVFCAHDRVELARERSAAAAASAPVAAA